MITSDWAESCHLSSVQFSRSSWHHGLQHARPPCPSPLPRACSNSFPLSRWCHSAISSSVIPFSSHLQSFPASGSFPVSQFFLCIRWAKDWNFSFSTSPSNEYPGLISFRMDRLDLLAVLRTLKSLLQHHSSKASILPRSAFQSVRTVTPCSPHPQIFLKNYPPNRWGVQGFRAYATHPVCLVPLQWKVKVKGAQSSLTLCNPSDYSAPGSSICRIFQARILTWVAIPFFMQINICSLWWIPCNYCLPSHFPSPLIWK